MTERRAPGARAAMLLLSLPGFLLCALVPAGRWLLQHTSPESGTGEVLRVLLAAPWLVLTIAGVVTPFFWPVVVAIAAYQVWLGNFRGGQLREAIGCVVASTLGIYVWLVLLSENLHGHAQSLLPWDPSR